MITRIKGTQDIIDTRLYSFLLTTSEQHLTQYNFNYIVTPVIEPAELFLRTVGTETDIVSKEMYFVHSGHEEDRIVLRPEITASIMRAFLTNSIMTVPWKVYTIGPVFRHERPQKGRLREFNQISIEIIGSSAISQDAYFITMLDRLFHEKLLLDNYALVINYLGCQQDRLLYKEHLKKFIESNTEHACATCLQRKERNILRILDCKSPICKELYRKAPHITDFLCNSCKEEWELLQKLLTQLSVSFTHDPFLVRGLDYYSKTIFEFVALSVLGAQSTFCAGGRYESIATQLGASQDYPSIGAALGIERVLLLLESQKDKLSLASPPSLQIVIPFDQNQWSLGLQIVDTLHAHNFYTDILLDTGSLKSKMRKAHSMGATTVLLVGTDEQQGRYITVKNLSTKQEERVPQHKLIEVMRSLT